MIAMPKEAGMYSWTIYEKAWPKNRYHLLQQSLAQIAHRIPHGKKTNGEYGNKNDQHIPAMNAYGISIDHKAAATTQRDEAEVLLQET